MVKPRGEDAPFYYLFNTKMKETLEQMGKLGVICRDNGEAYILGSTRTEKTLFYISKKEKDAQEQVLDYCKKYLKRNGRRLKK